MRTNASASAVVDIAIRPVVGATFDLTDPFAAWQTGYRDHDTEEYLSRDLGHGLTL